MNLLLAGSTPVVYPKRCGRERGAESVSKTDDAGSIPAAVAKVSAAGSLTTARALRDERAWYSDCALVFQTGDAGLTPAVRSNYFAPASE